MADLQIKQLSELTTTAGADLAIVQRSSNDDVVKVQLSNLVPAGTITPEKLVSGAGTSWAWTSWSPSYTGFAVGNGTVIAAAKKIGSKVSAIWELVCGTTTSIASSASLTLPYNASANYSSGYKPVGWGIVEDTATALHEIRAHLLSDNVTAYVRYPIISSHSGTVYTQLSTTIPITEASGDSWIITFEYEAA